MKVMLGSLKAASYLLPPGRSIEDVCWNCRFQLQRRAFRTTRPTKSSQQKETISVNEGRFTDTKDGSGYTEKSAVQSSSPPIPTSPSENTSLNNSSDVSEEPTPPRHRIPGARSSTLPTRPTAIEGGTVRYYGSNVLKGSAHKETYDPRFEQVRRQIQERAIRDQEERKLKARLDHAIQLSKLDVARPNKSSVSSVGPLHSAPPNRLGPSANASSRYTPMSPARQYSTNPVGEKVDTVRGITALMDVVL